MNSFRITLIHILREPILFGFSLLPLLLIGVIKLFLVHGVNIILHLTGVSLEPYLRVPISLLFLVMPVLLGTVMGFFMIDERDSRIFEVLRTTPLGLQGYFVQRLVMPLVLLTLYFIITYHIFSLDETLLMMMGLLVLSAMSMVFYALFVASVSEDKVKALTFAKAISGMVIFGFASYIPIDWFRFLSYLFPTRYIGLYLENMGLQIFILGFIVQCLWYIPLIFLAKRYL